MNIEALTLIPELGMNPPETSFRGATYRGHSPAARVVANWHDENHEGAFTMCGEQPCDAVRRVDE